MSLASRRPRAVPLVLALLATLVVVPTAASAADYVLTAGHWGDKQDAAVAAAGGTVSWSHGATGIGVATSDDPAFLDRINAGSAFTGAAGDVVVQWQPPNFAEEAITPNDEAFFPLQWNMQAIDAPAAWATGCTGAGVRVAINDGGIYSLHADLAPNLDTACSVSFVPGQPFNNDVGTFWHGTHVAGIVAAADNGFGVIGVAPEATLIGVKVLHNGSGSFGAVIGGILYAADPAAFGLPQCAPADIINMSLGAIFPKSATGGGQLVGAVAKAVNFATSKGTLVVSAAGNNGIDLRDFPSFTEVPADSGSGLAVSATGPVGFALGATNFDRPASYSNFGDGMIWVAGPGGDFVLPGSDVCAVGPIVNFCWVFDLVLSDCRGSSAPPTFSFCFAAGTSMATPAVSGVAALIKSSHPGISLGALKAKLAQTATDAGPVGHDAFYGHGFVNAFQGCTQ
jgi:subtilisin family serine protease